MTKPRKWRARCRKFKARVDYRSMHIIDCACGKIAFDNVWERDQYYKNMCCTWYKDCARLKMDSKMKKGVDQNDGE